MKHRDKLRLARKLNAGNRIAKGDSIFTTNAWTRYKIEIAEKAKKMQKAKQI